VHKKAQENFEQRTHKRVIKVWDSERETVDLWLRYLKKNSIGGVGMKAIVHEWVDFGFGREEVEGLEKAMSGGGDKEKVEKAAEELVKALGGEAQDVNAVAGETAGAAKAS
jgi:small subunit ribosomal protein S10